MKRNGNFNIISPFELSFMQLCSYGVSITLLNKTYSFEFVINPFVHRYSILFNLKLPFQTKQQLSFHRKSRRMTSPNTPLFVSVTKINNSRVFLHNSRTFTKITNQFVTVYQNTFRITLERLKLI